MSRQESVKDAGGELAKIDETAVVGRRLLPFAVSASLCVLGILAVAIVAMLMRTWMHGSVDATGFVQTSESVGYRAFNSGRVVDVGVVEGDTVEVGDLLVSLDTTDAAAEVQAVSRRLQLLDIERAKLVMSVPLDSQDSRARVEIAQARVESARRAVLRAMTESRIHGVPDSVAAGIEGRTNIALDIPSSELLAAKAELKVAQSAVLRTSGAKIERERLEIESAEVRAEFRATQRKLSRQQLRAAEPGIVTTQEPRRLIGETVSIGQLLVEIRRPCAWFAKLTVDESDIASIRVGDSADIVIPALAAFEHNRLRGVVARIIERQTQSLERSRDPFYVLVDLDSLQFTGRGLRLRDGYSVQAKILTSPRYASARAWSYLSGVRARFLR